MKRHFDRELAAAHAREPDVRIRPTVLERGERRLRGQLAAAQREAQPVAGHRIDEPRGITGEEQSGAPPPACLDGERAEADGAR